MSYLSLLSRFAHALNPRAREGLYALLPDHIASALGPPGSDEEVAGWEEDLLAALQKPGDRADQRDPMPSEEADRHAGSSTGLVALGALLLSKTARPVQGAQFLYHVPLHLQAPILHRLLTHSSLSCLRDIADEESAWVAWLRQQLGGQEHWGVEQAATIMRRADQPRAMRQLLEGVAAIDRRSALVLQQHLYHFTDLLQLSKRDLQLVLASESTTTLALALSGLSPAVGQRFADHISKRRRVLIAEESERYAEATVDEIEQAQGAVLSMARLLYERRRITTYMGALSAEKEEERADEQPLQEEEEKEPDSKAKKREKKKVRRWSHVLAKLALAAGCAALFSVVYLLVQTGDGPVEEPAETAQKNEAFASVASSRWQMLLDAVGTGGFEGDAQQRRSAQKANQTPQALVAVPGAEGMYAVGEFQVDAVPEESASDSTLRILNLRLGRLQATVLEAQFAVQTPLVQIRAPVGAVYSVRVVLDATTQVRVEKGRVEIRAIAGSGSEAVLLEGEERTFAAGEDW